MNLSLPEIVTSLARNFEALQSQTEGKIISAESTAKKYADDLTGAVIVPSRGEASYLICSSSYGNTTAPFDTIQLVEPTDGAAAYTGLYKFITSERITFGVLNSTGDGVTRKITVHPGTTLRLHAVTEQIKSIEIFGDICDGDSQYTNYSGGNHYTNCSVTINQPSNYLTVKFKNQSDYATKSDISNAAFATTQYTYTPIVTEEVLTYGDIDYSNVDTNNTITIPYKTDLYAILQDGYQYLLQFTTDHDVQNLLFTYRAPATGTAFSVALDDSNIKLLEIIPTGETISGHANQITITGYSESTSDDGDATTPDSFSIFLVCYAKDYIDNQIDMSTETLESLIDEIDYANNAVRLTLGPVNVEGNLTYSTSASISVADVKYQVIFDGVTYICTSVSNDSIGVFAGNPSLVDSTQTDNTLPFCWAGTTLTVQNSDLHTIAVYQLPTSV